MLKERLETIAVRKKERALKRPVMAAQPRLSSSNVTGMRSFEKQGHCVRPGVQTECMKARRILARTRKLPKSQFETMQSWRRFGSLPELKTASQEEVEMVEALLEYALAPGP